jgi:hypothetical protein
MKRRRATSFMAVLGALAGGTAAIVAACNGATAADDHDNAVSLYCRNAASYAARCVAGDATSCTLAHFRDCVPTARIYSTGYLQAAQDCWLSADCGYFWPGNEDPVCVSNAQGQGPPSAAEAQFFQDLCRGCDDAASAFCMASLGPPTWTDEVYAAIDRTCVSAVREAGVATCPVFFVSSSCVSAVTGQEAGIGAFEPECLAGDASSD